MANTFPRIVRPASRFAFQSFGRNTRGDGSTVARLNWETVNQSTIQLPDNAIPMRALLAGARRKESALLDLARKLVFAESPSDTKEAVDACAAIAADEIRTRSGRVRIHRQRNYGDILEARFGKRQ